MPKISIPVSDQLLALVKRSADAESRSVAGWVRTIITHAITTKRGKKCPQG